MLEIKELPSETKRLLTIAQSQYKTTLTAEEICTLYELGKLTENPPKRYHNTEGFTHSIKGRTFHPITPRIRYWLSEIASPVLADTPLETFFCLYASEFPDKLKTLTDPMRIAEVVQGYALSLNLTQSETLDAIEFLFPPDPLDVEPRKQLEEHEKATITQYIAKATEHFNGSFDDWLNSPESRLYNCVDEAIRIESQSGSEYKEQAVRAMKAHLIAFGVIMKKHGIDLDG